MNLHNNGNSIYYENSDGSWYKCEYDQNGNEIYRETSDGSLNKYDQKGNLTYQEHSDGSWDKWEYDEDGNEIYYEKSNRKIEEVKTQPIPDNNSKKISAGDEVWSFGFIFFLLILGIISFILSYLYL